VDKKQFEIKFSGLKLGVHQFDFQIDNRFFELFDFSDFDSSQLNVDVELNKKNNSLELSFSLQGQVEVRCDITNEPFPLSLENKLDLQVKYGEEYNDDNDEILIIPFNDHFINIAQYLYELAVLAVPLRKIHPDVESGKKGSEILKKLEELSPDHSDEENENNKIDPRWDKLKSLLN
jgi:uncharacterized metal-binding protein YceD (DUF177 family)